MTDEDSATDEERAEAEALARAIDSGIPEGAPDEAVATAAFLRAVAVKNELAPERARAVFDGLEQAVEHYVQPHRSNVLPLVWLGVGLAAAAAVALVLTQPEEGSPPGEVIAGGADLPTPSPQLLSAQAAVSAEGASDDARAMFERQMREYRAEVLRALKKTYPEHIGRLQPERLR